MRLISVLVFGVLSCASCVLANTSHLCNSCACVLHDDQFVFNCSEADYSVIDQIYQNESYMDTSNGNTLYDIYYLSLARLPLLHVKEPFPTSALKVLDLTDTDLLSVANGAFRNLQQMVELKLGHNRLMDLSPDTFKGLRVDDKDYPLQGLKILRLDYNSLHTIHNDAFQHIEQTLEELYLEGNPFKIIDLSTLQAIHGILGLRILDLSNTQLIALPQDFLHTPGKLEEFYLADNMFTNVSTLSLGMAHVLKKLVLNGNPFISITNETAFPSVPTLEVLHMCHMHELTVVGNHSLCELSGLKELHLADNPQLHTIAEGALTRIDKDSEVPVVQSLEKLDISNNVLTRLSLELDWIKLKDLNINGNSWTCEWENQWMVDTLIPIYCKINEERCKSLMCAAPIEMDGFSFYELHTKEYVMRRLDAYGNHPENDGIILVCFMLGMLVSIVCILFGVYAWKRNWFGVFDKSPAAYSRQFYGRTTTNDDFNG